MNQLQSETSRTSKWRKNWQLYAASGFALFLVVTLVPALVINLRSKKIQTQTQPAGTRPRPASVQPTATPVQPIQPKLNDNGRIIWSACAPSIYGRDIINKDLCAALDVPMDYTNPTASDRVTLALRKTPASCSPDLFLGTIIINPGGPGASGISFLQKAGGLLSTLTRDRYDILAFDPRGTGLTLPALNADTCQSITTLADLELDSTDLAHVQQQFAALVCSNPVNPLYMQSLGTTFVARDMREIMLAIGETSLNYWGFSYGSILGATFAAMFPELVNRMVLDGVAEAPIWFNDRANVTPSLAQTDQVLTEFIRRCIQSGPSGCAMAKEASGTALLTATELIVRISNILNGISFPVRLSDGKTKPAPHIDPLMAQRKIFHELYWPRQWDALALKMIEIEANGTGSLDGDEKNVEWSNTETIDSNLPNPSIRCSEANDDFYTSNQETSNVSVFAGMLQVTEGACKYWPWRAKEVYRGPWSVAAGLNKTTFPILFIGNIDPITPSTSAAAMARAFGPESATFLMQNSFGHTSEAEGSACTRKAIGDYFIEGVVPKFGTICERDLQRNKLNAWQSQLSLSLDGGGMRHIL